MNRAKTSEQCAGPATDFTCADQLHLQAADGWMTLGNFAEADHELDRLTPRLRSHPDVLALRWMLHTRSDHGDGAVEVSRRLADQLTEDSSDWIRDARWLRQVKGIEIRAAWDAMVPGDHPFPVRPSVAFKLACYACQMGSFKSALAWLSKAMELGNRRRVLARALRNPDLQPLWGQIRRL